MTTHADITVSGHVQGVCFRFYACKEATRLGVSGWVRNAEDGTVVIAAEGEAAAVAAFVDWCRHGPPYARVEGVADTRSSATKGYRGFVIRE